ncbi:hypothetical protein [Nissabacter sp. SGAir0207]|uniref:hypothetical protein n=1 Tax=Nissabacter sp. SGAir0207 TaxID=2126321 RepID=UPI0010CCCC08|nr:hypothetical protein [Nissabacter sp. SGAir0207]QCR36468.1 hypothetical protein C1N62_10335 [Nissabacter sp. SGAir0207]
MKMLHNERDYRNWIMAELFLVSETGEAAQFVDQEIEDFIFDARPGAYPCIAVMVQAKGQPAVCEPKFVYKEQVFEWAHQMGFGFDS